MFARSTSRSAPECQSGKAGAASPESTLDFRSLISRVQAGDSSGMTDLYTLFSRGVRFFLYRQLGPQELDDRVHDTFVIVVQAIQKGDLREPERLMGFVRTIVRRMVAAHIDQAVQSRKEQAELEGGATRLVDRRATPEERIMRRQKDELIREVMGGLSERDREVLTRFYLFEQSQEQICEDMGLTDTQFRLLKCRAKARFGELGRKKLSHGRAGAFSLRSSVSGAH